MTTRERFHAIMSFQPFDRLPVIEWAKWWDQTLARWYTEGLPPRLTDRYDICRHFGHETYLHQSIHPPRKETRQERQGGWASNRSKYDSVRPQLFQSPVVDRDLWCQWAEVQGRQETITWVQLDGFFWFPREVLGT